MKVLVKHWKYRNITLVFVGIVITLFLANTTAFTNFLAQIGSWGYVGAFLAGILFVSTFTVTAGALILFNLARVLNPYELAFIAGLGGVIGNLVILKIVRDDLINELEEIYNKDFDGKHITRILHTKYFHWLLPVIGAILIASPIPDEAGITLMGLSKISTIKFILISFTLNCIGIFTMISLASV